MGGEVPADLPPHCVLILPAATVLGSSREGGKGPLWLSPAHQWKLYIQPPMVRASKDKHAMEGEVQANLPLHCVLILPAATVLGVPGEGGKGPLWLSPAHLQWKLYIQPPVVQATKDKHAMGGRSRQTSPPIACLSLLVWTLRGAPWGKARETHRGAQDARDCCAVCTAECAHCFDKTAQSARDCCAICVATCVQCDSNAAQSAWARCVVCAAGCARCHSNWNDLCRKGA